MDQSPDRRAVLSQLLDKSVAIAVMTIGLYIGYRYHTTVMEGVIALVKQQNEYLRKNIDEKLDKILERLERK